MKCLSMYVGINCGPLPDIPNGRTNIAPDTMLGSIAIYTCNPGHKLIGIDQRHCQLDSTWSGIEPKCICKFKCECTYIIIPMPMN